MPQMLHVPGVVFTSFGCIGQMNPLVVDGRFSISGRAVPGIISWPDALAANRTTQRQALRLALRSRITNNE